jgi:diamine N-acetyltransferase
MPTTTVTLRPITPDNVWAVCSLAVDDTQLDFVAPNIDSLIASAYIHTPRCYPFAIYAGNDLVGFAMYSYEETPGRWWVHRLMIDRRFQGRGYGRAAMNVLIPLMVEREGMTHIVTSYVPQNRIAARLYESLGFRDTGEMDDGEVLMMLDVGTWNPSTQNEGIRS